MKRLNVKFIAILSASCLVLAIAVKLLHDTRVASQASSLKSRAQQAQQEGDVNLAVEMMSRYVVYRPEDVDSQAELARMVVSRALDSPIASRRDLEQAVDVVQRALAGDSSNVELQWDAARLYLRGAAPADAKIHLQHVIAEFEKNPSLELPDDVGFGEVQYELARAEIAVGDSDRAMTLLSKVLGYDQVTSLDDYVPSEAPETATVNAFDLYASLLQSKRHDNAAALTVINHMVQARPDSEDSYLTRARFLESLQRDTGSNLEFEQQIGEDIEQANSLKPDSVDVVLYTAQHALSQARFEQAEAKLKEGLEKNADDTRFYQMLAEVARRQERSEEALQWLDKGIERDRSNGVLLFSKAQLQVQMGDQDGVLETTKKLQSLGAVSEVLQLMEAEVLVMQGNYRKASRILDQISGRLQGRFSSRCDLLRSACARRTGNVDQQLSLLDKMSTEGASIDLLYQKAIAQESVGQYDDARRLYKLILDELVDVKGVNEERKQNLEIDVKSHLLQTEINLQKRKPKANQQWDEVKRVAREILNSDLLSDASKATLRLSILANTGNLDQAKKYLQTALQEHPDNFQIWSIALQLQEDYAGAQQLLEKMEENFAAQKANVLLRRVAAIAKFRPETAEQGLQQILTESGDMSDGEKKAVQLAVGQARATLGDVSGGYESWKQLADAEPTNLDIRMRLFRVALNLDLKDDLERWNKEVAELAGADSSEYGYLQALRSIHTVHAAIKDGKAADNEQLAQTKKLVDGVLEQRPNWPDILKISADVETLLGNRGKAIEVMNRLLELRPNDISVATPLIKLLIARSEFDAALRALDRIGAGILTPELVRIRAQLLEHTKRYDAALAVVTELAKENEFNQNDQFWKGRLLGHTKQYAEAERILKDYIKKAPKSISGWQELIRVLVAQGKTDEARSVMLDSQMALANDRGLAALINAQGYAEIGDLAKAKESYDDLARLYPSDPSTLRLVGNFYVDQGQARAAEPIVDRILAIFASDAASKLPDRMLMDLRWARRTKATLLAQNGGYADFRRGLDLIRENAPDGSLFGEDLQTYLRLTASRKDPVHQRMALERIEALQSVRPLSNEERYIQAQLVESFGRRDEYRDIMSSLVSGRDVADTYWDHWIRTLLQHDDVEGARRWFSKYPADARGRLPNEVELLVREGKTEEAMRLLANVVPKKVTKENSRGLLQVAALMEKLAAFDSKLLDRSETLYKEYVRLNPDQILQIAFFYGRQWDRLGQAFDECEKYLAVENGPDPAQVGQVIVGSLQRHRNRLDPNSPELLRASKLMEQVAARKPDEINVKLQQAMMAEMKKETDAAVAIYKQIADRSDVSETNRARALNNLAYRLFLANKSEDAMPYIQEALQLLGNVPDLLDTRAVILMESGKFDDALKDLRMAVQLSNASIIWLHLAYGELKSDNLKQAVEAYEAVRSLGLDVDDLDETDRKVYDAVVAGVEPHLPEEGAEIEEVTTTSG